MNYRNLLTISTLSLVLLGCSQSEEPVKATNKTPEAEYIDQMIAKAAGDPSRLSTEERQKMDVITRGNTDVVIRSGVKK